MKPGSRRYWCERPDGTIHRICVAPGQQVPEGYALGFGPRTPEQRQAHSERMRQVNLGKRVSEQTRELMREAKQGVSKTLEHRANMSASHRQRAQHLRQIQAQHPDWSWREVCAYLRQNRHLFQTQE